MGVVEDGSDCSAERGFAIVAVVPMLIWHGRGARRLTIRADRLAVPAHLLNVSDAIGFRREKFENANNVHCYHLLGRQDNSGTAANANYLKLGHSVFIYRIAKRVPSGNVQTPPEHAGGVPLPYVRDGADGLLPTW
jgi:hypothetical protein